MGIIRNQSVKSSISFYIGMAFGAINTVIIYPNVFKDNPEHFGLVQIILTYAIVVCTVTTLGIPRTFLKFFPAIKQKGQLFFLALITPLLGFGLASLGYYLFSSHLFELLNASDLLKDNFFYIILLVFFIGFYDILTSISRSFLSASIPIFLNEVFMKFYSMSVLLLHWFDYVSFTGFLQIYLFGYILKFLILFIVQFINNRLTMSISLKDLHLRDMLTYGIYVLIGGISIMLVTRIDIMMISSMLEDGTGEGLKQVAFYTVALFIGNAIMVPGKSISAISIPLIAKAWEQKKIDDIQTIYSKSSINQLIIGGVFFLCIWINIDQLFLFLPEKFQAGKSVVFYIGISQLFNMATGLNGEIIVNSRYYRYDFFTSIFLVFLTIATNFFFIQKYQSIEGAAIATAISVFTFNFIKLILIKVKMNMHPFSSKTIYTILFLFLTYLLLNFLPNSSYPIIDIIWKSLIVLIISVTVILYFDLSEDISLFIKEIKAKLF